MIPPRNRLMESVVWGTTILLWSPPGDQPKVTESVILVGAVSPMADLLR